MDAVQQANSGHPGMPMGMADVATVLWTRFLRFDPADPTWPDRDRFILSAGHGSMLIYSLIHLFGWQDDQGGPALSLQDLKDFRQWGSRTPGHPEYGHTAGVETTTGPLGQGFANGVGMALAEKVQRDRFGADVCDHWTYAIVSDGDVMEGIAYEAASLAGTLKLGRLVYLYDDNNITIDGGTDLSFSEDVGARFEALGWHVQKVDGHDREAVAAAITAARAETERPSIIHCRTVIGAGSPNKQGKSASHGAPLGVDEVALSKTTIGLDPAKTFDVPQAALDHCRARAAERAAEHAAWTARLAEHPMRDQWDAWHGAANLDVDWPTFSPDDKPLATRKASAAALNALTAGNLNLLGGSADLAGSNGVVIKGGGAFSASNPRGRNMHFGIREHAMASICNGMSLHGGVRPYCATFLVFSDYMRASIRLAGLMNQPVIFVFTHDSIYLGEDGPTHQPVEHVMSLRLIPNVHVIRPADATETAEAWKAALTRTDGPTCLVLTRQGLPILDRSIYGAAEGVHQGGYVLVEADGDHALTLIATGSEVELAMRARTALQADGIGTRVVSMPCWGRFAAQDAGTRAQVLGSAPRIAVEAGRTLGWERYADRAIGHDDFGASAPASVLMEKFGFTVENIQAVAAELLG
jgi:transketolase